MIREISFSTFFRMKTKRSVFLQNSANTTPKETPLQSPTVELSTENSLGSEIGERAQTTTVKTEITIGVTSSADKHGHHIVSETTVEQKSDESRTEGLNDLAECDMTGK